jgi:MICOS complex subunit MIC60
VPLGASVLQYAEDHDWDTLSVERIIEGSQKGIAYVQSLFTSEQANKAVEKTKGALERTKEVSKDRIQSVTQSVKTTVTKATEEVKKDTEVVKHQASQFSEGVEDLVRRAEDALAGKVPVPKPDVPTTPSQPESVPQETSTTATEATAADTDTKDKNVYNAPLPIGFEPPPGYAKPAPQKPAAKAVPESKNEPIKTDVIPPPPAPDPLPLVAPAVREFAASEPIIAQLATVIDDLASYLNTSPTAAEKARDVLDTAKIDLTSLATRIEEVKEQERQGLEAKLDEQTREYTIKLLEMEMEAQDRLDSQEEGFRKQFEEEKAKFVQAYRAKLNQELQTQSEIINER